MRTSVSLALMLMLTIPSLAQAQEKSLLAAAEFAAAELAQQQQQVDMGSTRRSMGRVALGLAIAGAGAAMLLIDPKQPTQPTQPGTVSDDVLIQEYASLVTSPEFLRSVAEHSAGSIRYFPNIRGGLEQALDNWALGVESGLIFGGAAALTVATSGDRTIYAGQFKPFIPFKERSPGMKYGGAALAVTGALVAGL
jgi:type II secretory pathway pseudopilin PulG